MNGNDQIQTLKKIELISCITRNIHHRRLRKCKLENLYLINSTSVRTYTWPLHTHPNYILHTFSIRRSSFIFTRVRLVCVCLQIFRLFFVCSAIFFRLLCNIFFSVFISIFGYFIWNVMLISSVGILCTYYTIPWEVENKENRIKSERWKAKNRISFCKLIQFQKEFTFTLYNTTHDMENERKKRRLIVIMHLLSILFRFDFFLLLCIASANVYLLTYFIPITHIIIFTNSRQEIYLSLFDWKSITSILCYLHKKIE